MKQHYKNTSLSASFGETSVDTSSSSEDKCVTLPEVSRYCQKKILRGQGDLYVLKSEVDFITRKNEEEIASLKRVITDLEKKLEKKLDIDQSEAMSKDPFIDRYYSYSLNTTSTTTEKKPQKNVDMFGKKKLNEGSFSFFVACADGDFEEVLMLLNRGANTNSRNNIGDTP